MRTVQKISEPCPYNPWKSIHDPFSSISLEIYSFSIDTSLRTSFPFLKAAPIRVFSGSYVNSSATNQRCMRERVVMVKEPWIIFPQFFFFWYFLQILSGDFLSIKKEHFEKDKL